MGTSPCPALTRLALAILMVAAPTAIRAQTPGSRPRIALVYTAAPAHVTAAADAARHVLADAGLDVANVVLSPDRAPELPIEAGGFLTVGPAATHFASRIANGRPVVYCLVAQQQLPRLSDLGGPIHGVSIESPLADQLALVAAACPKARRIGALRSEPDFVLRELAAAGGGAGLTLEYGDDAAELLRSGVDLVWLSHAFVVERPAMTQMLLLHSLRSGVPVVAPVPPLVTAGAPIGLGMSPEGHGRQAAEIASHVLAGRPTPHVSRPELELHVNDRTLRTCGLRLGTVDARIVHHGGSPR